MLFLKYEEQTSQKVIWSISEILLGLFPNTNLRLFIAMNSILIGQFVIFENNYRNGKNVIRLKGSEPAMATIAAIGSYFAAKDDPFQACYYLESIEAKLKTVANGGGIIKSENATIFGSPAEEISPAKANILLDRLTEYRGVKQQFENNHEEAIR